MHCAFLERRRNMARISVLFSGSKGNCTYVKYGNETILIDAGVSAKRIFAKLIKNGICLDTVKGIFITHEHIDHVKGLRVFASKYGIRVYANKATISALRNGGNLPSDELVFPIQPNEAVAFENIRVTAFRTSHDAVMSMGYTVETSDSRKAAYVTDLGKFSPEVFEAVKGAHAVVLESNHDLHMLRTGDYPYSVKERIAGEFGHLSNDDAAKAAVSLVSNGTGRLILAHLSRDNNTCELAAETVCKGLYEAGLRENKDYLLYVAASDDGREYIY